MSQFGSNKLRRLKPLLDVAFHADEYAKFSGLYKLPSVMAADSKIDGSNSTPHTCSALYLLGCRDSDSID
jgi:hypothetical protein